MARRTRCTAGSWRWQRVETSGWRSERSPACQPTGARAPTGQQTTAAQIGNQSRMVQSTKTNT